MTTIKQVQDLLDCEKIVSDSLLDVISFWCSNLVREKFPNLSKVACGVLSIPASSAASERTFTSCGSTISKKRAQLSGSTVDFIIVLHSS